MPVFGRGLVFVSAYAPCRCYIKSQNQNLAPISGSNSPCIEEKRFPESGANARKSPRADINGPPNAGATCALMRLGPSSMSLLAGGNDKKTLAIGQAHTPKDADRHHHPFCAGNTSDLFLACAGKKRSPPSEKNLETQNAKSDHSSHS